MMIPNKFNGYSRDGVRLYFDPATIASLATMMEGAGAASSAAAAVTAAEAAAAAAAATAAAQTAATTAPTMLETISGAMQAGQFPGATAAPVAETAANTIPMITAGVPSSTGTISGSEGIKQAMQAGPPPGAESPVLMPPAGEVVPNVMPPDGMNQGIFSDPTMPSAPVEANQAGMSASDTLQANALSRGTGIDYAVPQGGTLDAGAGAGGLDSLGAGIEKAMKFMTKNAPALSMGMQAISYMQGQQGPKRSTFKPGYRLSPNFQPTLAPSAPSGVYGRGFAEGGIAVPNEMDSAYFNGGIAQYAKGGVTRFMGGGYNGMQGQYGPTEEETAAAAKAATPEYDINALYQKYFGRDADESGRKTYDPKKFTQQQLAGILQGSEEYKGQTLDATEIQNAYKNVLKRDVDPTGATDYLGQNYSPGAFEDALKQSKEYKEVVPFRTMERTVYKPEYEDYTKNPITSVPGMAIPDKLSYAAIQEQLGGTPTYDDVVRASAAFEANKPTSADQYLAMAKKSETTLATGGSAEDKDSALQAKYAKLQGVKTEEQTQADVDDLVAYQRRMNEMGINTDDDVDTRLLDPYSAAQVRLAKVGKKYKVPVTEMPKTSTNLANMAMGGITQNLGGYSDGGHLLKGPGDGMSDHIPATIGKNQPARLADGEFVIPADVVSHLGNGSTEAGAKQLYAMMSRIRKARTGNPKQGKQVNPRKLMPK
jgi:hypothetical protein